MCVALFSTCAKSFQDAHAWNEEVAKGKEALRKRAAQEAQEDIKAAREKALEKDDVVTFLRSVDLLLLEHVVALAKAKLSLSILRKLTEAQLEADLKEAGLPAGARRQIASALQEATAVVTESRDNALRDAFDFGHTRKFVRRVDPQLLEQMPRLESAEVSLDILKQLSAKELNADLLACGLKPDAREAISNALAKTREVQGSSSTETTELCETATQKMSQDLANLMLDKSGEHDAMGNIRKATDAEIAATQNSSTPKTKDEVAEEKRRDQMRQNCIGMFGRTGGALIGDYVMITPFARQRAGILKPWEIGKLIDANVPRKVGQEASLYVVPLAQVVVPDFRTETSFLYFDGDVRRATFEDAEVVFETVRLKAYTENDLKVLLFCSLVKDIESIYPILLQVEFVEKTRQLLLNRKGKRPTPLATFNMARSTEQLEAEQLKQHLVPVGVWRKLEKTLELAAKEHALQTLRNSPFYQKLKVSDTTVVEHPTADKTQRGNPSIRNRSILLSSRTDKPTNSNMSARKQAYDAGDLRNFIRTLDESLVKYADVLESHELTLDLLKALSAEQIEADLRESGLPVGARRKLALALDDAVPRGKAGIFNCMSKKTTSAKSANTSRSNSANGEQGSEGGECGRNRKNVDDGEARKKDDQKKRTEG